jgi:uncharacterized protein (UPF0332 family)
MDGNHFIALAGRLAAGTQSGEAEYRTAISRACYGTFHLGRSFLVELGYQPIGNANVHAFVQRYLNGSGHADACFVATQLAHLQSSRNRADYNLDDSTVGLRDFAMVCVE